MGFFYVVGFPRSGTAWMANFLTYGPSHCFHDGLIGCPSFHHLRRKLFAKFAFNEAVGNSDSGMLLLPCEVFEKTPTVLIDRNPIECRTSLLSMGLDTPQELFDRYTDAIAEIRNYPRTLVIPFERLTELRTLRAVWDHCVGGNDFDTDRALMLAGFNVQLTQEALRRQMTDGAEAARQLFNNERILT